MEKLSNKCLAIIAGALACLITAIALAPAAPSIPRLPSYQELEREFANAPGPHRGTPPGVVRAAGVSYQPVQNCTGGDSVNCHIAGNQAGL